MFKKIIICLLVCIFTCVTISVAKQIQKGQFINPYSNTDLLIPSDDGASTQDNSSGSNTWNQNSEFDCWDYALERVEDFVDMGMIQTEDERDSVFNAAYNLCLNGGVIIH